MSSPRRCPACARSSAPASLGGRRRPIVEVVHDAEREEVLAAVHDLAREVHVGERLARQRGKRHLDRACSRRACRPRAGSTRSLASRRFFSSKLSELTMRSPFSGRSDRFTLRAAGFMATSTSGSSPGVWMSWLAKLIWKPLTPGQRSRRGADLRGIVGERADVVADEGGGVRELVAGDLHPVAGVAREADDDSFDDFQGLLLPSVLRDSQPSIRVLMTSLRPIESNAGRHAPRDCRRVRSPNQEETGAFVAVPCGASAPRLRARGEPRAKEGNGIPIPEPPRRRGTDAW